MVETTLESWHSRAMRVDVEGVGGDVWSAAAAAMVVVVVVVVAMGSRRAAQAGLLAFTVAKMESVPIEGDRILNGELERKTPLHLSGRHSCYCQTFSSCGGAWRAVAMAVVVVNSRRVVVRGGGGVVVVAVEKVMLLCFFFGGAPVLSTGQR